MRSKLLSSWTTSWTKVLIILLKIKSCDMNLPVWDDSKPLHNCDILCVSYIQNQEFFLSCLWDIYNIVGSCEENQGQKFSNSML